MGEIIWKTFLVLVTLLAFFTIASDAILSFNHRQTISAWLRLNPEWYFYPAFVFSVALMILCVHLFVRKLS